MQYETKLVKKFEEFDDGRREVEFLSWSPVDFLLYVEDCIVGESGEIGRFRDVLPDELVHVLDRSFLPRRVAVGEIDGRAEGLRDVEVGGEPANPDKLYIVPLSSLKDVKCRIDEIACYNHDTKKPLYYDIKSRKLL